MNEEGRFDHFLQKNPVRRVFLTWSGIAPSGAEDVVVNRHLQSSLACLRAKAITRMQQADTRFFTLNEPEHRPHGSKDPPEGGGSVYLEPIQPLQGLLSLVESVRFLRSTGTFLDRPAISELIKKGKILQRKCSSHEV